MGLQVRDMNALIRAEITEVLQEAKIEIENRVSALCLKYYSQGREDLSQELIKAAREKELAAEIRKLRKE